MNTVKVENCKTLFIGRRGENEVTEVVFDFTEWQEQFGAGVIDLYVKRSVDFDAYPVVLSIDGTVATWLVTAADTAVVGSGKIEFVYTVDQKVAKSAIFPFYVGEDIGQASSEPPDPYESWIETLTELGTETQANAQTAAQSASDAADSAASASESAGQAEDSAEDAEAWAVGERDGEPVSAGDETYENNAKYWAENARENAPVQSVNGKDGNVELTLDDIPNGETFARATPEQLAQIGKNADDIADIDAMIPSITSESNHLVNVSFLTNRLTSYRTSAAQDAIDAGKQSKITAYGILKRDRSGNITAAIAGADYVTADALNSYRKATAQDAIDNAQNQNIDKNTAAINTMQPAATAADIGKALIVKTVADGKPTSYEYGEAGGGGSVLTAGDGIDIANDVISNTQGIEYIVGTQTAATSKWTGVSTDETLKVGKIIAYYLPFAGTSTVATLALTMADGTTTREISLQYKPNSSVTTQFPAGSIIILVYDGTYWRVNASYDTDTNTYPTGYCVTNGSVAAKAAACSFGYRGDTNYFPCLFRYANTAADATLAITTYAPEAAPIYVNGARTSAENTFSAGVILFLYYNGAYYCYNDGRFPILVDGAVTSVQEYATGLLVNYRTAAAQDTIDAGKQAKITATGILKGDGAGGVSSAVAGVDYLQTAPVTSVNGQTGDVTVQVATDAQVTTAVNDWLDENVAQETGYVLDASLTMSNAAPPASAVGDLKSALTFNKNNENYWAVGGISSSNGNDTVSTTRLRTTSYIDKDIFKAVVASGYKLMIFAYLNGAYQGVWNGTALQSGGIWLTRSNIELGVVNAQYDLRLAFALTGDGTIAVADSLNVELLGTVDSTLTIAGKPADAKATGLQINDLESAVSEIDTALNKSTHSSNYLNPNEILKDVQIKADGAEEPYAGRNASGWIPASTGDTVYFAGINSDSQLMPTSALSILRLAWYNSDKTFIGATTWTNGYALSANDIAFIRICYVNSAALSSARVLAVMFTQPTAVTDIEVYDEGEYHIVDRTARNMIKQIIPDKFVDSWGDSRIANGGSTTSVTKYLANMLGWYAANHGFGGQGSGEIAITMGAIDCYVTLENNQIIDGDNIVSAIYVNHGSSVQNVMQNSNAATNGVPCSICGINGFLWNYGGVLKFTTASTLSNAVTVMPMTKVLTPLALLHRFIIIWAGKNDFSNYSASGLYEYLADTVSAMAEHIPHERFVILGETATSSDEYKFGGAARTVMDNYNNLMARRFPNNFINIQNELVENGLDMAGITPTETDISDIQNGWLPSSLMSDTTHQNGICRNVIAQIIYSFMADKSWT